MATSSSSATAAPHPPPRRETESSSSSNAMPTAKFLQARIDTLRNTLVSRLENIFAAAIDDTASVTATADDPTGPAPPLTDTAAKQLQIDVESTALIRATEEIMLLTRTMKELWLFGGLDTIIVNGEDAEHVRREERLKSDEREVVRGLMEFLSRVNVGQEKKKKTLTDAGIEGMAKVGEDVKMEDQEQTPQQKQDEEGNATTT